MKDPKDELYLIIPHPITDEDIEFDLERESNIGLVLRLIEKRESIIISLRSNYGKIEDLREKHGIDNLDKRGEKLLEDIKNLSPSNFESGDLYDKKIDEYHSKLNQIKDQYPQEIIDLQNKTAKMSADLDRVGIKLCSLILSPVGGIPDEYNDREDYMQEIILDEKDVADIITFFLNVFPSTMKSRKESAIRVRSRRKENSRGNR